jgi:pimeloyl-ACP methyl ester carboxylesterase
MASPHPSDPYPGAVRPPIGFLWREALALVRLWPQHAPLTSRFVTGDGDPVLIIPGFLTSDASTAPLRHRLSELGYAVHGWDQGVNLGATAERLNQLGAHIAKIAAKSGQPVRLIGWSLGGLLAREAAKRRPHQVAQVITLGSPFSGDPRANRVWRLYEWLNGYPVDHPPIEVDLAAKPPVPTIALWSRCDGIVHHACACGQPGEADRTIEVDCSHIGFMFEEPALQAIARALLDQAPEYGEPATSPFQAR